MKKNEILTFVTSWVDLAVLCGIILRYYYEISQAEEDKYCMISLIRGIFFKVLRLMVARAGTKFQY